MAGIPENLADWRYDTVVEVVEHHEFEPTRFEYKAALNPTSDNDERRDENLGSIRRTVCAMANTGGGFILFGVRDRRQSVAQPKDRVIGIPTRGDHRRDFAHKIGVIQPEVHFDATPILLRESEDSGTGVFVVSIPESASRPHMVEPVGAFYKRGDGGNAVSMGVYEVRDQMLYGEERRRKANLLRMRLVSLLRVAQALSKKQSGDLEKTSFDWTLMTLMRSRRTYVALLRMQTRLTSSWLPLRVRNTSTVS